MADVATRRESPAAPAYGGEAPWAETADAVACLLGVDPAAGLAGADALERLRRHGENVAAATTPRAWWRVLLDQFKGAKYEGTWRNHMILPDGTIRDTCYYSIIASEWPAVRRNLDWRLARGSASER